MLCVLIFEFQMRILDLVAIESFYFVLNTRGEKHTHCTCKIVPLFSSVQPLMNYESTYSLAAWNE